MMRDFVSTSALDPGDTYRRPIGFTAPEGCRWRSPPSELSDLPSHSETPLVVQISPSDGVHYHYTTDGRIPTTEDSRLPGLILERPTSLRVRGFADGRAVTQVVTRTVWIGPQPEHAVLMLTAEPSAIHHRYRGIIPNCRGRGREWERDAHCLFLADGDILLDGFGGLRTHAGKTTDLERRTALRLYCREMDSFRRNPFGGPETGPVRRVVLDANRNNWRDVLVHGFVDALGGTACRTRTVQILLNGENYNLVTMIEMPNEDFLVRHFGHDEFDLIKAKVTAPVLGTKKEWHDTAYWIQRQNWKSVEDVEHRFDLEGMTAIHVTSMFTEPSGGGKFQRDAVQSYAAVDHSRRPPLIRFIAWDLDHSFIDFDFDLLGTQQAALENREFNGRFLNPVLIQRLLDLDPGYRLRYLETAQRGLNHVFGDPRWVAYLSSSRGSAACTVSHQKGAGTGPLPPRTERSGSNVRDFGAGSSFSSDAGRSSASSSNVASTSPPRTP